MPTVVWEWRRLQNGQICTKSPTTSGESKVSKAKKMATLDHSAVIQYYHIAVSCMCDSLWCAVWGNGQTFSHSSGLRAPEGASAHPAALGQCYSIHHMKRTLATLLSITCLSLPLALSHSLCLYFFFPYTYWHVVICLHSEWWPQHMKYRLFITISTGQAETQLKSWTLRVSITQRDKTKAP